MKAWRAVAVLAVVSLVGCGGSRELNRAHEDADALRAENAALNAKVSALEGQLASVTKERDELKTAAERTLPSPTGAQVRTTPGSDIRAVSENEYEIPREELDKALNDLNQVALDARIVPVFKDGAAVGFRLFAIRPGSIYYRFGLQNGDIIHRINGVDLDSPEKVQEAYSKAKDPSRLEVDIERGGALIHNSYTFR